MTTEESIHSERLPVTFTLPLPAAGQSPRAEKSEAARIFRRVKANLVRQGYDIFGIFAFGLRRSRYRVLLFLPDERDRIRVRRALQQSFPDGPVPRLYFAKSQEQGREMVEAWWKASHRFPVWEFYGLPADWERRELGVMELSAAALGTLWGYKEELPAWAYEL